MKRPNLLELGLLLILCANMAPLAYGQKMPAQGGESAGKSAPSAAASSQDKPASQQNAAQVRAGTRISADLESAVDTRTAKPGDEVVARVTKDVKQNGRTVIRKGDHLVGRIRSVESSASADAGSHLAVTFDRLVQGQATSQLHTVLTAVLSTPAEQRMQREQMAEPEPAMPMAAPIARSGSGAARGGLVGGVASTAGSTVGGVSSTVNSTVGSTANATAPVLGGATATAGAASRTTLGSTTGTALATPLRAIRVESHAQGTQQTDMNSVLSTRRGNLRLDSGTRLQFRVAAQENPQGQAK